MSEKYEQMELDTRPKLNKAVQVVTDDAISTAKELILESRRQEAAENGTTPTRVRNRHEAYGIAAEQLGKINKAALSVKGDVAKLLMTLSDPNYKALDATSDICNSTTLAAATLIHAAAEMKRTLDDLYAAEIEAGPTPMEELAEGAEFQDAESIETDNNEMEDE